MSKRYGLILLCSAIAFASGTTTPATKTGAKCATSTVEGAITLLNLEQKTFSVAGHDFKVAADTTFRIPGATRQDLKETPLSKVPKNARVKVLYCTKDGTPVEVKIER
jgi:hypothetical protein